MKQQLIPTPLLLFHVICYTTILLLLSRMLNATAERGGDKS